MILLFKGNSDHRMNWSEYCEGVRGQGPTAFYGIKTTTEEVTFFKIKIVIL
jgi:hypothetical protein